MFEQVKDVIFFDSGEMREVVENFDYPLDLEEYPQEEISDPEFDEDYEPLVPTLELETAVFQLRAWEPLSFLHLLRRNFGNLWWEYEVSAICDTLSEEYTFSQATRDRIFALQVLHARDEFWCEWEVFNWVTQGLQGLGAEFEKVPELQVEQLVVSLMTADLAVRMQDCIAKFGPEVKSYIALTCLEAGYWVLPYPLDIVQARAKQMWEQRGFNLPVQKVLKAVKENNMDHEEPMVEAQTRCCLYLQDYHKLKAHKVVAEIRAIERRN